MAGYLSGMFWGGVFTVGALAVVSELTLQSGVGVAAVPPEAKAPLAADASAAPTAETAAPAAAEANVAAADPTPPAAEPEPTAPPLDVSAQAETQKPEAEVEAKAEVTPEPEQKTQTAAGTETATETQAVDSVQAEPVAADKPEIDLPPIVSVTAAEAAAQLAAHTPVAAAPLAQDTATAKEATVAETTTATTDEAAKVEPEQSATANSGESPPADAKPVIGKGDAAEAREMAQKSNSATQAPGDAAVTDTAKAAEPVAVAQEPADPVVADPVVEPAAMAQAEDDAAADAVKEPEHSATEVKPTAETDVAALAPAANTGVEPAPAASETGPAPMPVAPEITEAPAAADPAPEAPEAVAESPPNPETAADAPETAAKEETGKPATLAETTATAPTPTVVAQEETPVQVATTEAPSETPPQPEETVLPETVALPEIVPQPEPEQVATAEPAPTEQTADPALPRRIQVGGNSLGGGSTLANEKEPKVSVDGVKVIQVPSNKSEAEAEAAPEVPAIDPATLPAFQRYAATFDNPDGKPPFAVVLIDSALDPTARQAILDLPMPVTVALDPIAPGAADAAAAYRAAGIELVMLASAIPAGATASDIEVTFQSHEKTLPETVAVLDLQQGGFQDNRPLTTLVAPTIASQGRGLLTWDRGLNSGAQVAEREGMASGLVFLSIDKDGIDPENIRHSLDRAAFKAGQEGSVIVAANATPEVLQALVAWSIEGRGASISMAPVTAAMTPAVEKPKQ